MKKYIGLILGVLGIVVLIGGASLLYNSLSEKYGTEQQLVVQKNDRDVSDTTDKQENNNNADAKPETENMGSGEANKEAVGTEQGYTDPSNTTDGAQEPTSETVYMAIDFTVEDIDGNQVNLYSFIGDKPIVLNFWASWCGPCKNELPDFQAAYEAYDGEVQFLMVNMTDGARETKETASEYMAEQGYTLPVYYDTAQSAAYAYAVYSLPTTYFISASGELTAAAQGMIDAETLEKGISMIYASENDS